MFFFYEKELFSPAVTANMRAVLLGDSITSQNYGLQSNTTQISQENTGNAFTLYHAETGGAFEYNVAQNYGTSGSDDARQGHCLGVSGNTTTQMLARITDVTDLSPDIVFFMGGTNDISGGSVALATTKSNIEAIAAAVFAADATFAIYTVLPRNTDGGGSDFTSGEKANLLALNAWIRGKVTAWLGEGKNAILIDPWPYFSTGSSAKTGYTKDGVHPSSRGAQLGILPALRAAFNRYNLIDYTRHWNQTAFNASTAPYGNQLSTPMAGTAGSTDTAATGDVVTNYRVGNNGSAGALSYVCSVIDSPVDDGSDKWQKIAITSTGAGSAGAVEQCLFRPNPTTNALSVEDGWYRLHAWVYIYSGGDAILNSVAAFLDDRTASHKIYSGLVDNDSPAWDTTEAYALNIGTDLYMEADGTADDWRPEFRIYAKEDVAGTVEVAIGRCTLERINGIPAGLTAEPAPPLPAYSLDFEASSTQYLSMTQANFGWSDADTWGLAFSLKRESVGTQQGVFSKYVHASSRGLTLNFTTGNTLIITVYGSGNSVIATATTSDTYASTSAWYHFYVEFSKSGETVKIYEGGSEASYSSRTNPTSGGNSTNIGTAPAQWGAIEGASPLDGLLHQATFFDGSNPGVGTVFDSGVLADLSGLTGVISLLDGAGGDPVNDAINANDWTNNNTVTTSATVPS